MHLVCYNLETSAEVGPLKLLRLRETVGSKQKASLLFNVIFFLDIWRLKSLHKKLLPLWVSTNSEEGSMGRKS